MRRHALPLTGLFGLLLLAPAPASGREPAAAPVAAPRAGRVDVAICLDTSSSMDGLINATRTQLWDMVNTLSRCQAAADPSGRPLRVRQCRARG